MRVFLLPLVAIMALPALAQKTRKEDAAIAANLHRHVTYLASDELEGRRTGTEGERLAADYITQQFMKAGLAPKGSDGFLQVFEVNDGLKVEGTQLRINGKQLVLNQEFFPLAWSGNSRLEGKPSIAMQEQGVPWFQDLKEMLEENKDNPHFDLDAALHTLAATVQKKGATALLLYNSSAIDDALAFDPKDKTTRAGIPVIYIKKEAFQQHLADASATHEIVLVTVVQPSIRQGHNVAAYLDNGAQHTIVIGAHYDHLGYGEDGNSMYRGSVSMVHHGADDNASGTAGVLELARILKDSKYKNNNYLFVAFSGEELGLYGSKYFVEHPTVELASINYMINMDMVGRLNDSTHHLTVGGYGTTPSWGALYGITGKKRLYNDGLVFQFDSSGVGPSDHTSFYRKDIPVLFYFTGLHTDYHKPGDEAEKVNYTGEVQVLRHVLSLLQNTDVTDKLVFTKTRDLQTGTATRFKVTLGIMPDYTFSGTGIRADGISDGRPAQKAGLQAGDIIISLGDYKVGSMETYMQALGKFKKGETTKVTFLRNGQEQTVTVTF
jgi:aminopeptidase YwaD